MSLHYILILVDCKGMRQLMKYSLLQYGTKMKNLRMSELVKHNNLISNSLIVSQINNLPIPSTRETKKLQLIITASVYHANQELKKTQSQPFTLNSEGKIDLHETLMFGIQTMNLPKVSH